MTFRNIASALLIAGTGVLGGLQYIQAQANPFEQIGQSQQEIQRENFFDTHVIVEPEPSPLEIVTLRYHEGVLLAKGSFDITRNRHTTNQVRVKSDMPNSDRVNGTLDVIVEVMENYPPYMLREQCNIQAIYITTNIYRNDERANGIAFREGILLISEQDTKIEQGYREVKRVTQHEIFHGCEFGNVSDHKEFDNEWITIAQDLGTEIQYVGEDWKNLDHSATYEGFSRSYSRESPMEHRATMWEDVMTLYTNSHLYRFPDDSIYQAYFYRSIQLMREWSNGLMDHEVYGLLARNIKVDREYYERTYGDRALIFKPAEK